MSCTTLRLVDLDWERLGWIALGSARLHLATPLIFASCWVASEYKRLRWACLHYDELFFSICRCFVLHSFNWHASFCPWLHVVAKLDVTSRLFNGTMVCYSHVVDKAVAGVKAVPLFRYVALCCIGLHWVALGCILWHWVACCIRLHAALCIIAFRWV